MTLVPLDDFAPSPRDDGVPFTVARVEQAAGPSGPWSTVHTETLTPVDPDPNTPLLRSFLVDLDLALWTRVVFVDGDLQEQPTDPLPPEGVTPGLRPSVSQVGALLRARTKVGLSAGRELGTFTEVTRPTGAQVEELIDEAVDEVTGKIGIPAEGSAIERRARRAIGLYTAMLVELSFFPEQVKSDRSAYDRYKALYDSRITSLIADAETGGGGGGEGENDSPANASWYFPPDGGGLVGWQSRW